MNIPIVVTAVLAFIIIPTGTPDDIITYALIKWFGEAYLLILLMVILLLWYHKLTPKKVEREMKNISRSVRRKFK